MSDERHRKVRDDSDELLTALDRLKNMERAKRDTDISTPPFHDLAEEVEQQARHVFDVAAAETVHGEVAPTTDVSTNEVRPTADRSH